MNKYSNNKKLETVLISIEQQLLSIHDSKEDSINEIKRYYKEFPKEKDYNLYQYGNLLIYYYQIKELYKDYKSLQKVSVYKLEEIYKRQVGYVVRQLLKEF